VTGKGHAPRKRYGQHFLHDRGVIAKIVAAVDPQSGDAIVEIGPGTGALTAPLLDRVARLEAVEIDRDLAARLEAEHPRLALHRGDVLRFDFARLPDRLRVVGNLPYNVSTPLLFRLVEVAGRLADPVLGVAGRIGDVPADRALPRTRAHGVRQRHVLVEDDPELDHPEEEERQNREHEGELGERLALLPLARKPLEHLKTGTPLLGGRAGPLPGRAGKGPAFTHCLRSC